MSEEEELSEVEESDLPEGVEDDLKSQYGKLVTFNSGALGAFAFRRMPQVVNDRLNNEAADSKDKMQAIRTAVLSCLVYPVVEGSGKPDFAAARAVFEAAPDMPVELVSEIKDLAPKFKIKKR